MPPEASPEPIDQYARQMAFASATAWANMLATALSMLAERGFPKEVVREFLDRLDTANDAMLADGPAKSLFQEFVVNLQASYPPNGH